MIARPVSHKAQFGSSLDFAHPSCGGQTTDLNPRPRACPMHPLPHAPHGFLYKARKHGHQKTSSKDKTIFWNQRCSMVGCSYDLKPTCENTLMVDDNASRNILNPTSNYIVCPTWMVKKIQNQLLLELNRYLQAFVAPSPNLFVLIPYAKDAWIQRTTCTEGCTLMKI